MARHVPAEASTLVHCLERTVRFRSTLLGLCVVLAAAGAVRSSHAKPNDPASVDAATRERSRAAFRRGVTQLRAEDWAGARASFEEAWALVQHPSILLNLGIARLRTGDPVLAEADLVRFLSEDPGAAPEEIASARDALAEARSQIGTLRVVVSPASARVVVDGKPVAVRAPSEKTAVAEARLKAGTHEVSVEAEGFVADERSVKVPAKSETEITVELVAKSKENSDRTPPGPQRSGSPTRTFVGWSLAGVGGVAFVASGLMGLRALSLSSDYSDQTNRATYQNPETKSDGIAFRTGADIALIVAVLAGAGSAILLLTDVGAGGSDVARRGEAWRISRGTLLRW